MINSIKLFCAFCLMITSLVNCLPARRQRQLFRNDFFRGVSIKHFARGPKPPIKAEETTMLIPFTKWKSTQCEMKKNIYKLRSPQCKPKTVNRGLCYGQCSSVFIPGQNLHYSAACIPILQQQPVEMDCDGVNGARAKRIKFYEKVVACSCRKVKVDWKQVVREIRSEFEASSRKS